MAFLECDLEDIIMNSDRIQLEERGLVLGQYKKRQVIIGNYGKCDIISLYRPDYEESNEGEKPLFWDIDSCVVQIVELKQNDIGFDAFHQAIRYCRGIKSYLEKRKKYPKFEIILIGKQIPKNTDTCYLPDIFANVFLYTYSYDIDGIHFVNNSGYTLVNEGF